MASYILRRLLATIPVMAVVAIFVFFLLRLAPGDPAAIIAGDDATTESIAAVREKLGLDRPVLEQFGLWDLEPGPDGDLRRVRTPLVDAYRSLVEGGSASVGRLAEPVTAPRRRKA